MYKQFENVEYSPLRSQSENFSNIKSDTMSKDNLEVNLNEFVADSNEEMGHKHFKSDFSENITTVVHIFIIQFVVFILYLSFSHEIDLFTWHPILLSVGWSLFMIEAILAISTENWFTKFISSKNRILVHWVLQIVAAVCIITGFVIVVINKNLKNKQHFKTWHATFGLVSIIFFIITCLVGVLTIYKVNLRQYITPKFNKWLHIFLGVATFIFGAITVILSLYSNWFVKKTVYSLQVVSFIGIVVTSLWVLVRPTIYLFRGYIKF